MSFNIHERKTLFLFTRFLINFTNAEYIYLKKKENDETKRDSAPCRPDGIQK